MRVIINYVAPSLKSGGAFLCLLNTSVYGKYKSESMSTTDPGSERIGAKAYCNYNQ